MSHKYRAAIDREEIGQAYSERQGAQNRKRKVRQLAPISSKSRPPVRAVKYKELPSYLPHEVKGVQAGDLCNPAQQRLSKIDTFTGLYKNRFQNSNKNAGGDYCRNPLAATRLLQSVPSTDLNIPGRALDFRDEVEWRLQLRPQFN